MSPRKGRLSLDQRAALRIAQENPGIEYLRLSRKQICEIEINAAVRLFLFDEDPISAHLLASAAIEIMSALSNGQAGVGLNDVRALMKSAAVPFTIEQEVFNSLQHPYNFLKHGSSDFSVENEFSIEHIVMTIYMSINSYNAIFGILTAEMKVFYGIVQSWRVRWWADTPDYQEKLKLARKMPLAGVSRERFCEYGRDLLQKVCAQDS